MSLHGGYTPPLMKRRLFVGNPCSRCRFPSNASSDCLSDHRDEPLSSHADTSECQSSLSCDEPLLPIRKDRTVSGETSKSSTSECDEHRPLSNYGEYRDGTRLVLPIRSRLPFFTASNFEQLFSPPKCIEKHGPFPSSECVPLDSIPRWQLPSTRFCYNDPASHEVSDPRGDESSTPTHTPPAPTTGSQRIVEDGCDILSNDQNNSLSVSPCLAKTRRDSLGRIAVANEGLPRNKTAEAYTADEKIFFRDLSDAGRHKALYIVDIHLRAWPSNADKRGWQCFFLPVFSHLSPADYLASLSFACWAPDGQPKFDFDTTYLQSVNFDGINQIYANFDCSDDLLLRWRSMKKPISQLSHFRQLDPQVLVPRQTEIQVYVLHDKSIGHDPDSENPISILGSTNPWESKLVRSSEPQIKGSSLNRRNTPSLCPNNKEKDKKDSDLSRATITIAPNPIENLHNPTAELFPKSEPTMLSQWLHNDCNWQEYIIADEEYERETAVNREAADQRPGISWTDFTIALGADDIGERCRDLAPINSHQWLFLVHHDSWFPNPIVTWVLSSIRWMIIGLFSFIKHWWWIYPCFVIFGICYLMAMSWLGNLLSLEQHDPIDRDLYTHFILNVNHSLIDVYLASPNDTILWQHSAQIPTIRDRDISEGEETGLPKDGILGMELHEVITHGASSDSHDESHPWSRRLRDAVDRSLGWKGEDL